MQAWQLPQCALAGASAGSGRSVRISPRKNHEPASRAMQVGVLADPAEPGIARERLLQHRRRVDEHAVAERSDALPAVWRASCCRPRAQDLVVVAAERVARDVAAARRRRARLARSCASARPVVHARADHAHGARAPAPAAGCASSHGAACSPSRRESPHPASAAGAARPPRARCGRRRARRSRARGAARGSARSLSARKSMAGRRVMGRTSAAV